MEDIKFETQTNPKASAVYMFILAVFLAGITAVAYFLFSKFSFEIFLCGILFSGSCVVAGLMYLSALPVLLKFKNDELFIRDSNQKEYHVYAVPASDFIFIQTPLEKKYNIGTLIIKHTVFFMVGVKNVAETKAYIHTHFPHW